MFLYPQVFDGISSIGQRATDLLTQLDSEFETAAQLMTVFAGAASSSSPAAVAVRAGDGLSGVRGRAGLVERPQGWPQADPLAAAAAPSGRAGPGASAAASARTVARAHGPGGGAVAGQAWAAQLEEEWGWGPAGVEDAGGGGGAAVSNTVAPTAKVNQPGPSVPPALVQPAAPQRAANVGAGRSGRAGRLISIRPAAKPHGRPAPGPTQQGASGSPALPAEAAALTGFLQPPSDAAAVPTIAAQAPPRSPAQPHPGRSSPSQRLAPCATQSFAAAVVVPESGAAGQGAGTPAVEQGAAAHRPGDGRWLPVAEAGPAADEAAASARADAAAACARADSLAEALCACEARCRLLAEVSPSAATRTMAS
jgi:hypothetical protein